MNAPTANQQAAPGYRITVSSLDGSTYHSTVDGATGALTVAGNINVTVAFTPSPNMNQHQATSRSTYRITVASLGEPMHPFASGTMASGVFAVEGNVVVTITPDTRTPAGNQNQQQANGQDEQASGNQQQQEAGQQADTSNQSHSEPEEGGWERYTPPGSPSWRWVSDSGSTSETADVDEGQEQDAPDFLDFC